MCLTLRDKWKKPYSLKKKYRFKALTLIDLDNKFSARSAYVRSTLWALGQWEASVGPVQEYDSIIENKHDYSDDSRDYGFHMFVHATHSLREALDHDNGVVGVFEVKSFIASGTFNCAPCETWNKARLVALYNDKGTLLRAIKNYKGPNRIKV